MPGPIIWASEETGGGSPQGNVCAQLDQTEWGPKANMELENCKDLCLGVEICNAINYCVYYDDASYMDFSHCEILECAPGAEPTKWNIYKPGSVAYSYE